MNKTELIDHIAQQADISKAAAGRALDAVIGGVKGTLKKGGSVTLVGFGTFAVGKRTARTGRNPRTGAAIKIKDSGIKPAAPKAYSKVSVKDDRSGKNCRKPGLLRLVRLVLHDEFKRAVVENKDRLLKFGVELVAWLCTRRCCELVIISADAA